jgi:hypothetical protein
LTKAIIFTPVTNVLFNVCGEIKRSGENINGKKAKMFPLISLDISLIIDEQTSGSVEPW